MYEGNRESITGTNRDLIKTSQFEENVKFETLKDDYSEAIDIFPALHKYKKEHNVPNLQKLCVEISEFCRAVYSSTTNDKERQVYKNMLAKLSEVE